MNGRARMVKAAAFGVLVASLGLASTAGAQTSGTGDLGPGSVRASARDLGSGTFPGGGLPSEAPSLESPYEWGRAPTGARCMVFPGPVPAGLVSSVSPLPGVFDFPYVSLQVGALLGAPAGAVRVDGDPPLPPGVVPAGDFVIDTATPRVGTDLLIVPRCVRPGEPLLPALPTAAEIWQETPLPRATVHANPPGTQGWPGIVNLESRFWGEALPDARAAVDLRGYVVTAFAHPVAYAWTFGDGTTSVSDGPGGPDAPARADFRRRGDYEVTLYVVWAGIAHTTAPALGLDFGVQNLGTVTVPETVGYHEAEIRALLRLRTAGG